MRRVALLLFLILVLTFSPNRLQAKVVKGSWTKLDSRPAGERIVVRLRSGTRVRGSEHHRHCGRPWRCVLKSEEVLAG